MQRNHHNNSKDPVVRKIQGPPLDASNLLIQNALLAAWPNSRHLVQLRTMNYVTSTSTDNQPDPRGNASLEPSLSPSGRELTEMAKGRRAGVFAGRKERHLRGLGSP